MIQLHLAASETLPSSLTADLRDMLEVAFEGDFTDDDWAHALGGHHVWLTDPQGVLSHASLVGRRLVCGGRTLQVGYVEAVATASAHRRRGHGSLVMSRIGELVREQYELGALSTGAHAFFERLGWERWRGEAFVDGPRGRERTPDDDGGIMILRTPRSLDLDLDGVIVADWRAGDVW